MTAPAPPPLPLPVRLGPYTLVRRIGAGGMGEVFLARDEEAGRAVVVKKVLPRLAENRQFLGRFRDEARVVRHLDHPRIARVHALGEEAGQLYLAMEYVQGKTLSRFAHRLRAHGRTLPLGLALLVGERVCEGLAYAHEARGVDGRPLLLVHRDLSPANVCISYAGDVKIIDFGAAQSSLKLEAEAPRVVIGNLTYMSPEQALRRGVDRRADVYSLAVLLWELLAWRVLPQKGEPLERWRRAAYPAWHLEPPSQHRPALPPEVDAVLGRALQAEPELRYEDARRFGAELARLRARLDPYVSDEDLGRLLSDLFARERAQEEELLRQVEAGTEAALAVARAPEASTEALAPPTALAFEHRALAAPVGYVPSGPGAASVETDAGVEHGVPPEAEGPTDPEVVLPGRRLPQVREAREGFGVEVGTAAARVVREIEGEAEPTEPFTPPWSRRAQLKRLAVGALVFALSAALGFCAVAGWPL